MTASKFYDVVGFTTPTTGTASTAVVGSALACRRTPAQASIPDGTPISYAIADYLTGGWENGHGVTGGSGTTFTRAEVDESSAGGALIALSGSAQVAFTLLASDLPTLSAAVPREVTGNTSFTALPTDEIIGLVPNVPASFTITLPLSSSRNGVPITIVDLLGFLGTDNVSVAMTGGDLCLGLSTLTAILNQNFQSLSFKPRASGGYFL